MYFYKFTFPCNKLKKDLNKNKLKNRLFGKDRKGCVCVFVADIH